MTDESRTRDTEPRGDGAPGDSSGVDAIDTVNEGARKVLGDAQVSYGETQTYNEPDEAALQTEAALHGDRITRNPDGTHEVISVAPGPADDPAGGWADLPAGRKGDGALTETVEETEARQAEARQAEQRDADAQTRD